MKTDLFQSCGHCWDFQICWHIECSTFRASSVRIWNSSTGIPSPPLALFMVMLPKSTWLHIPGCLALDEWSHHCDYLGHEDLFCAVRWALESITMNKASGGDGIPVEPFQILNDDALKVLHSICQQIWKTQQWPQDWKRSVFIQIPKKGNAKECSNYLTYCWSLAWRILSITLPACEMSAIVR